jgi:hypothetical protein
MRMSLIKTNTPVPLRSMSPVGPSLMKRPRGCTQENGDAAKHVSFKLAGVEPCCCPQAMSTA